ncbi:hypothetical protein KUTeg_013521 [Tegillarca granosa]|uniref:BPTI/Kunitz inhibitor domain-containing protein n=1 Tax=Tegillarca granosa TaxID=220873 RepID=A0ABQ9ETY3_TEGGR|nr:hypothetical protein KUTeg_013521 [Tegillarca granosa]
MYTYIVIGSSYIRTKQILQLVFVLVLSQVANSIWKAPELCMLPASQGNCMAYYESYFFNRTSGKCEPFIYGGCGGNDNRFHTFQECFTKCSCHMPADTGPCKAGIPRWYYNPARGCCEKFKYGGCQGNSNNFQSMEVCEAWCAGSSTGPKLPLGTNWGSIESLMNGLQWMGIPGLKWGGGKNIWLHNENIASRGTDAAGNKVFRIVSNAGKTQVPGVQTKANFRILSNGVSGANIPVAQTGGTVSQVRRVQTAGSPVTATGSARWSLSGTQSGGGERPGIGGAKIVGGRFTQTGGGMVPGMGGAKIVGGRFTQTGGGMVPGMGGARIVGGNFAQSGGGVRPGIGGTTMVGGSFSQRGGGVIPATSGTRIISGNVSQRGGGLVPGMGGPGAVGGSFSRTGGIGAFRTTGSGNNPMRNQITARGSAGFTGNTVGGSPVAGGGTQLSSSFGNSRRVMNTAGQLGISPFAGRSGGSMSSFSSGRGGGEFNPGAGSANQMFVRTSLNQG